MKQTLQPLGVAPLVRLIALVGAVWISACSGENPEATSPPQGLTPKAASQEPAWARSAPREERAAANASGSQRVRVRIEGGLTWLEAWVEPESWKPSRWEGVWQAPRLLKPDSSTTHGGEFFLLEGETGPFELVQVPDTVDAIDAIDLGSFAVSPALVYVWSESAPSERLLLRSQLEMGEMRNGVWRATVAGSTFNGVPIWTGEEERIQVDVPPDAWLEFGTLVRALDVAEDAVFEFVLLVDDQPLFEFRADRPEDLATRWHRVSIPDQGEHELTLRVSGPPGLGAFLTLHFAVEPPTSPRPDVVLFLADTFRADLLEAYGGRPEVAPELNRFAEESLLFEHAWSVAGWTLPSQATMLTGLFPPQHGAATVTSAVPQDAVTLAGYLSTKGYRTGAITDSGFVSQEFGMDQGFEWFEEHSDWSLRETLESARRFLAVDDGRPTFLFIQTFRTHVPYRAGVDESRAELRALLAEIKSEITQNATSAERRALEASAGKRMHALYESGASGLDQVVGAWFTELERDAWFDENVLLFTSDHGDAFYEHGSLGHGDVLWPEVARIPMFLRGKGITPGRVLHSASLADVPRTLCDLLGVEPHSEWLGEPLHKLARDRRAMTFSFHKTEFSAAVADGARRVHFAGLARDRADLTSVSYDMEQDRAEQSPVDDLDADYVTRLLDELLPLVTPVLTPTSMDLNSETRARLKALGYLGDE